jgi:prolyl 4-hydroxylase
MVEVEDAPSTLDAAERLEAEGRHEDAVNCLARAAQHGDADALKRLGLRLLSGDHVPCLPAQGVALLSDAVDRGSCEAAARLAVLAALGVEVRRDWRAAFELMQRSAALGWAPAREQLRLLAGDRGVIDLEAWTAPPAPEILAGDPLIRRFPGFAAPDVCDWLIEQARTRLVRAEVYDHASGHGARDDYRNNSAANFSLSDTSLVLVLLQAKIAAAIGVPFPRLEAANVLHYAVGEKFDEHFDYIDPRSPGQARVVAEGGQRLATCIVYLNDDYEGGETEFTRLGLRHKGRKGEALVFLSARPDGGLDPRSAHAGRPPAHGEKWIAVQFVRDRDQLRVTR